MGDDLDLYGRGSTPRMRSTTPRAPRNWKRTVSVGLVTTLVMGFAGYRWMTTTTPVSQDKAVELFRSETADSAEEPVSGANASGSRQIDSKRASKPGRKNARPAAASAPRQSKPVAAAGTRASSSSPSEGEGVVYVRDEPPEEGVYSWHTEGYEEAGGARRSMPEESQRIVTLHDRGWKQHHYFSEQREIWTTFLSTDRGAAISYQRNKVVFGPITNDSFIDFAPPMLVGPRGLEVGQTWKGSWEGETYGNYEGRTFERVVLDIGGEQVEAFGIRVDIHLRGEQRGDVVAEVWVAPEYAMTVKEHFIQDVSAGVGNYHAEWTITLKSLEPRR